MEAKNNELFEKLVLLRRLFGKNKLYGYSFEDYWISSDPQEIDVNIKKFAAKLRPIILVDEEKKLTQGLNIAQKLRNNERVGD